MLTVQEIIDIVPKQHRSKITQEFVDAVNSLVLDPDMAELYEKNTITYSSVMADGRYKIQDYFNAVLFVSYKMMNHSSLSAYQKVFPARVKDMTDRGMSAKDIHAYSSAYNKNKLVSAIYEQTLIPDYIFHASVRHKAIKRQAELMYSDNENVAQKAADSLLNHLKAPENSTVTLDVTMKDTGIISELSEALNKVSSQQFLNIKEGRSNAIDVAEGVLIEHKNEPDD